MTPSFLSTVRLYALGRAAVFAVLVISVCPGMTALGDSKPQQDGNRLTYLDEPSDPYYPNLAFPKLLTPQWVGEPEVEAVVTLGIDDMRKVDRYEAFLRPILERLKKIDGRAPVSIVTNSIDPQHEQLQKWLAVWNWDTISAESVSWCEKTIPDTIPTSPPQFLLQDR